MDKNEVMLLAQLLHILQTIVAKIEIAQSNRDIEAFNKLKKEAIEIQKRIDEL